MILGEIVKYKKREIKKDKETIPLDVLIEMANSMDASRDFRGALLGQKGLGIIGEIKKASPSKGIIRADFTPEELGENYSKEGVNAISVLTERKFFQGHNSYLIGVRERVDLPLLRKDFIIDPYQIYQSKALGADAILLIARILTDRELRDFQGIAQAIGLQTLVEVHNREDLERVLQVDPEIIGINNRDLKNFKTDLRITEGLMEYIPKDKIVVSESGIKSRDDMSYLQELGVKAVLIGEALMRAPSMGEKVRELRGN